MPPCRTFFVSFTPKKVWHCHTLGRGDPSEQQGSSARVAGMCTAYTCWPTNSRPTPTYSCTATSSSTRTCIVMVYIVMACVVITYIVMVYLVMALPRAARLGPARCNANRFGWTCGVHCVRASHILCKCSALRAYTMWHGVPCCAVPCHAMLGRTVPCIVHVLVCTSSCAHCMRAHMHACVCAMCICVRACMCASVRACMHAMVCVRACMRACVRACVRAYFLPQVMNMVLYGW